MLKKTMRLMAKKIYTKFQLPFTLGTKFKKEKLVLAVSSLEDIKFHVTQKNNIATVDFAFEALNKVSSLLILETGGDFQDNIGVCISDFAKMFGGDITAYLISDSASIFALSKRGGILLDSVGIVTSGRTLTEAVLAMKILLKSKLIYEMGEPKPYDKNARLENFIYKHFTSFQNERKILKVEREAQSNNSSLVTGKESLASIIVCARKMENEELAQGAFGSISVRHGNNFFMTPNGKSYSILNESDIVKVSMIENSLSVNVKSLHRQIYKARKDVGAIIHAYPISCSVSSASYKPLWVADRMKHILGNEVKVSNIYDEEGVVSALGNGKAVFIGGHGVVVVGETLQDAYWTLNVLEDECYKFWGRR